MVFHVEYICSPMGHMAKSLLKINVHVHVATCTFSCNNSINNLMQLFFILEENNSFYLLSKYKHTIKTSTISTWW